jgi:hypothetical protein
MPLRRLRRVLEAQYRVKVESSNQLIRKVNRKKSKRQADLQAKLAPIPPSENATLVAGLERVLWRGFGRYTTVIVKNC